ncbi:hypothetical protein PIB30_034225 [Stylosanthes scabra]|uniref:Uncharacterized protein n=1 Tax=Stylosanthes scabra TaxID=79078 RepID=A0ABU6TCZ3_9FABA|nr:hypothetical protein [Stylosanthes scabra]
MDLFLSTHVCQDLPSPLSSPSSTVPSNFQSPISSDHALQFCLSRSNLLVGASNLRRALRSTRNDKCGVEE